MEHLPLDMFVSQGIFAVLFVWLLINSRKESKEREDRLMTHLEKTTDTLELLTTRMETIGTKVENIDNRLTVFESDVKSMKGDM
ncbi:BhlA/UviB family holin-like peptide [Lysinibacillus telephonicus]|uniref:BhlA/UviB family holin-like peptide n=1 Tax=Lysinibacillus telephonicus TaxID=1714840 RepID=UPI0031FC2174